MSWWMGGSYNSAKNIARKMLEEGIKYENQIDRLIKCDKCGISEHCLFIKTWSEFYEQLYKKEIKIGSQLCRQCLSKAMKL